MISIIDYGLGNINAFVNVYKSLNIKIRVIEEPKDIVNSSRLILPGVGAFGYALQMLKSKNMIDAINEAVLVKKIPILGICVGMQILSRFSEEGNLSGLEWIDSNVKSFKSNIEVKKYPIPHMGWNNINIEKNNPLLSNLNNKSFFYFLHSYYFDCNKDSNIVATTEYGNTFTSVVNLENIFGVQFHPEKSHEAGSILLKNFASI